MSEEAGSRKNIFLLLLTVVTAVIGLYFYWSPQYSVDIEETTAVVAPPPALVDTMALTEPAPEPEPAAEPIEKPMVPEDQAKVKTTEPDEKPAALNPATTTTHTSTVSTPAKHSTKTNQSGGFTSVTLNSENTHNTGFMTSSQSLLEGQIQFIKGHTAYYLPDSMLVDQPEKVTLSIGELNQLAAIKERVKSISGVGTQDNIRVAEDITIGRKMRARLKAVGGNFKIEPGEVQEQFVDLHHNKTVDWIWYATAKKPGTYQLDLILEVYLKNDLGENYRTIPVHSDQVEVVVDPDQAIAGHATTGGMQKAVIGSPVAEQEAAPMHMAPMASASVAENEAPAEPEENDNQPNYFWVAFAVIMAVMGGIYWVVSRRAKEG